MKGYLHHKVASLSFLRYGLVKFFRSFVSVLMDVKICLVGSSNFYVLANNGFGIDSSEWLLYELICSIFFFYRFYFVTLLWMLLTVFFHLKSRGRQMKSDQRQTSPSYGGSVWTELIIEN
ncbi:hypothetical protein ACB098_10G176200 [Castanea mollissima]